MKIKIHIILNLNLPLTLFQNTNYFLNMNFDYKSYSLLTFAISNK